MRYSKHREELLQKLCSVTTHPSADVLYGEMRKTFPNISLATVYRNLAQLKESGAIRNVITSDGKEHFDGNTSDHGHFVCEKCHKIIDVFTVGSEIDIKAQNELGARIRRHDLTFYGLCADCANDMR